MSELDIFAHTIEVVLPFAEKLKKDMIATGRTKGRRSCPLHEGSGSEHWVHVRLSGPRNHLAMACDDDKCRMRMIE